MLWIKRNLALVIFGAAALALLGGGLFYLWTSHAANKEKEEQVEKAKQDLEAALRQNPAPNATNISFGRAELQRVQAAVKTAKQFFQPVPFENVTNQQPFKTLLNKTIYDLQQQAKLYNIELPRPDYAFSFEAQQRQLHSFAPGSFPTLPIQLAEVKTLCGVIFESKVHKLLGVKRWRVTVDDPPGSSDYHDMPGDQTNEVAGVAANLYELNFHSFSPELATVLDSFTRSPFGLTVKSLKIEPVMAADPNAPGGQGPTTQKPPPPPQQPVYQPVPIRPGTRTNVFGTTPRPAPAPPPPVRPAPGQARPGSGSAPAPAARDTLQTVVDEHLLNITLRVEVVKTVK